MAIGMLFLGGLFELAHANNVAPLPGDAASCGVLQRLEGDAQILNADRSQLLNVSLNASIPCSSWISINEGYVEILHRQGHLVKLSSNTLAEIFDNQNDQQKTGSDHLVLFKGSAYLDGKKSTSEFRVLTPNARARVEKGIALVVYSLGDEDTQIIALREKASLENRFEASRKMEAAPGEATSLNFKFLRVVPTAPKNVSVASLKILLNGLSLTPKEFNGAMDAAVVRAKRTFATQLAEKKSKPSAEEADRVLASEPGVTAQAEQKAAFAKRQDQKRYERYAMKADDKEANDRWLLRVVGGDPEGKDFLFPKLRNLSSKQKEKVYVRSLSSKENPKWVKEEHKRIISSIRSVSDEE